jgi:hypothetical protein
MPACQKWGGDCDPPNEFVSLLSRFGLKVRLCGIRNAAPTPSTSVESKVDAGAGPRDRATTAAPNTQATNAGANCPANPAAASTASTSGVNHLAPATLQKGAALRNIGSLTCRTSSVARRPLRLHPLRRAPTTAAVNCKAPAAAPRPSRRRLHSPSSQAKSATTTRRPLHKAPATKAPLQRNPRTRPRQLPKPTPCSGGDCHASFDGIFFFLEQQLRSQLRQRSPHQDRAQISGLRFDEKLRDQLQGKEPPDIERN